jgi:hypothetical protein
MARPPESTRNLPAGALVPATEEDRRELELALAETGGVELSPEELRIWAETGECPASLR